MSYHQKIECNVSSCAHNCLEDSTCRLDRIMINPCSSTKDKMSVEQTICGSYNYVGNMNIVERLDSGDI